MSVMARLARAASIAAAAVLAGTLAASAEDSDQLRGYLHLKFRDTNELTGVHDYYGFGLGANLNRYIGVELSGDRFEIFPRVGGRTIGEYGVFALMPQVRLRYPLFGDRIVPYLLGGAGVALTDFNDRKAPAFGVAVRDESSAAVGTLGGGVDFFLSDNVAFNAEVKYLLAESQTLRVGGVPHRMDISTPLTSVGLRVFLPENRPPAESPLADPTWQRLYFNARIGLAEPFDTALGSGIEIRPVPPAVGGALAQYFGLAFGLDATPHLGVEMGAEGYEVSLNVRGVGTVTEYAVYGFTPRLRLRYPLGEGRWVPYGITGLGLAYSEANDRKPHGAALGIRATSEAILATAGLGLDYFVASNIALGLETKYLYSPGHRVTIAPGHSTDATLQALAVSFGVRVYLWDFHI